jgi:hypothetical protein
MELWKKPDLAYECHPAGSAFRDRLKVAAIARQNFGAKPIGQGQSKCIGQRYAISNFMAPGLLPKSLIHVFANDQTYGAKIVQRASCRILPRPFEKVIKHLTQVYRMSQTSRRFRYEMVLDDFRPGFVPEKCNHCTCVEDKIHSLLLLLLHFLVLFPHMVVAAKRNPSILAPQRPHPFRPRQRLGQWRFGNGRHTHVAVNRCWFWHRLSLLFWHHALHFNYNRFPKETHQSPSVTRKFLNCHGSFGSMFGS